MLWYVAASRFCVGGMYLLETVFAEFTTHVRRQFWDLRPPVELGQDVPNGPFMACPAQGLCWQTGCARAALQVQHPEQPHEIAELDSTAGIVTPSSHCSPVHRQQVRDPLVGHLPEQVPRLGVRAIPGTDPLVDLVNALVEDLLGGNHHGLGHAVEVFLDNCLLKLRHWDGNAPLCANAFQLEERDGFCGDVWWITPHGYGRCAWSGGASAPRTSG
jgi:hypothetical protein